MNSTNAEMQNLFLHPFDLPYGAVPFDRISLDDYLPAFKAGIAQAQAEEEAIVQQPEAPTFENTIVALEQSGATLDRVSNVFFNLLECDSSERMMSLAEEVQPLLSEYANHLTQNRPLFSRIEAVWQQCCSEEATRTDLTAEQRRLVENYYKDFVRGGARLTGAEREEWEQINTELDRLTLLFGQNVLKATEDFELLLTTPDQTAGLPDFVLDTLAADAARKGKEGWLVTLKAPSYRPFMTYSSVRSLREQLYRAYAMRAAEGTRYSNEQNMRDIVRLRLRKAQLLGYADYSAYSMERTMAHDYEHMRQTLTERLHRAYRPVAEAELDQLHDFACRLEGTEVTLHPWDLNYYSNQLKKEQYDINDELLKPYFALDRVIDGVFGLAHRLYGLTFSRNLTLPAYAPDVHVYEVKDRDGSFLGLFYADFFARDGKQQGAWMTEFKQQWREADGTDSRPHISIVANFAHPTPQRPSLLTYDEVNTLLHEFGHALHGLLTRCTYKTLSGTNVTRDFVEMPSQFMENYLRRREFLDTFARHYQTGEAIPQELIDRIIKASNFQAGYLCMRQLMFVDVDMAYHTVRTPIECDHLSDFERTATAHKPIVEQLPGTTVGATFTHIFSGGYAAGYYSYKWSEVLDADAFSLFEERGIFDPTAASRLRTLLERGNSERPEVLYRNFRGRDPEVEALMRRDGVQA